MMFEIQRLVSEIGLSCRMKYTIPYNNGILSNYNCGVESADLPYRHWHMEGIPASPQNRG